MWKTAIPIAKGNFIQLVANHNIHDGEKLPLIELPPASNSPAGELLAFQEIGLYRQTVNVMRLNLVISTHFYICSTLVTEKLTSHMC